jgi:hypothetical protein
VLHRNSITWNVSHAMAHQDRTMENEPKIFRVSGICSILNCSSNQQNFSAEIKQINLPFAGFIFRAISIWQRESAPRT